MWIQGLKQTEEAHQDAKTTSISSYVLKTHYFLTHIFKYNKETQDNLFKSICNFLEKEYWSIRRRYITSYLGVNTIKDKDCLINPKPLEIITG